MKFKKFDKSQRGHFDYYWNHLKAFNYVAKQLGVWKFKYLSHDFEKPWLMLFFLGNYPKVQKWHRTHNSHHLEYNGEHDWEAMVIDWECSHYTKTNKTLLAIGEANRKLHDGEMDYNDYCKFIATAHKLGLTE